MVRCLWYPLMWGYCKEKEVIWTPVRIHWGYCTKTQRPWIRQVTHCNGQLPVKLMVKSNILYDTPKLTMSSGWKKRWWRFGREREVEIFRFWVWFLVLFFSYWVFFFCSCFCVLACLLYFVLWGDGTWIMGNTGGLGGEQN